MAPLPLSGRSRLRASRLLFARWRSRRSTARKCFQDPDSRRSRVVVGKTAQPPFRVPNLLLLAVPHYGGRVLFAIAPPILGMARAPLLRTVAAHLAILWVRGDLLTVMLRATAALAVGAAAHQLTRLIFRWQEAPPAEAASPFDHTAVVASCVRRDLETAVEWVLHPRQWLFSAASKLPEMLSFYLAINMVLGCGIFNRRYGDFCTGIDTSDQPSH